MTSNRATAQAAELQYARLRQQAELEQQQHDKMDSPLLCSSKSDFAEWEENHKRKRVFNPTISDKPVNQVPLQGDSFNAKNIQRVSKIRCSSGAYVNGGFIDEVFHLVLADTLELMPVDAAASCPELPATGHPWIENNPPLLLAPSLMFERAVFVKRSRWWDIANSASQARHMLLHEALVNDLLARMPHPHIARYLGVRLNGNRITGLVFEKYPKALADLKRDEFRTIDKAAFFRALRSAVAHLHRIGLAHNDIKPDNIMVRDGLPYLIDFGSANTAGARLTGTLFTKGWARPAMVEARTQGMPIFSDRRQDDYVLAQLEERWDTVPNRRRAH